MIGLNEKLTIKYYDGVSTYTDYSDELVSYQRDSATITLASSETLYVGYRKPINMMYAQLDKVSDTSTTLSVKYYNGSSFAAVTNLNEETNAFNRSGFIQFDRNLTNEAKTTIDGDELFWYELTVGSDTTEMIVKGLNILFSDDAMISEREPALVSSEFYPENENSFVTFHQAARNHIIQRLRNEGKGVYVTKENGEDVLYFREVTAWDLLDASQLGQASMLLAISMIYFERSDGVEDKYYQRYMDYRKEFNDAYDLYFLSIDKNDDGKQSDEEKQDFQTRIINRA